MPEQTVLAPRPDLLGDLDATGASWKVIVFNNDHNTWEEVTQILIQATACSLEEAEMETWEVDNLGRSTVHYADKEECERVAAIIRTIGIRVEVEKE